MKRLTLLMALLGPAAGYMPLYGTEPVRTFHDSISQIADTLIFLPKPPEKVTSQAIEIRGSLPDAENYSPLQALSVVWGVEEESGTYYRATLRPHNPMPDEVFDYRYVLFSVEQCDASGSDSLIYSTKLRDGISLDRNENTLGVEIDFTKQNALIYGGNRDLQQLYSMSFPATQSSVVGLHAEGRARLSLVVSEYTPDQACALTSGLTSEMAIEMARNAGAPAGVYKYLDRKTDSRYSRLGGEYVIAVVPADDGAYDIIYIDGAQTRKDFWQPGMIKGHMTPTLFKNHYDLTWYDAEGESAGRECSATIEQDAILTLKMPLLKAELRFALMTR